MKDATDKAQERAEELGVDIDAVEGTGQDGRVTVTDVEGYDPSSDSSAEEEVEGPPEVYMLNPALDLGGYNFDADFDAINKQHYLLTQDKIKKYASQTMEDRYGVKRRIIIKP